MNRFVTALAVLGVVATTAHAEEKPKPAEGGEGGYTGLAYRTATDTVVLYGLLDITLSGITNADEKTGPMKPIDCAMTSGSESSLAPRRS